MAYLELVKKARLSPVVAAVKNVDLVLTVTSGRSGTKLLTKICSDVLQVSAKHEPEPRVNFALRPAIHDPSTALDWLQSEKFPAWAQHSGQIHVETTHLICKGFIEPLLVLGIRPRFILLTRPASQIAASLFQMGVIPARTDAGDLVLMRPDDPGVLPFPDWSKANDYALCYWYALEIERRQAYYAGLLARHGIPTIQLSLVDLLSWRHCRRLSKFLGLPPAPFDLTRKRRFREVTAVNQNRRSEAFPGHERTLPSSEDRIRDEARVIAATLPYFVGSPLVNSL